ncbi:MAG: NAD(P)-binding domain-containing protein [Cyclobacteriaceae bacterium]
MLRIWYLRDAMKKACIIGAGPSGITAAKNLIQVGITDFVVYEKSDKIGGNWVYSEDGDHSSVFETTHIISSKKLSQYEDYPMPDDFPDYPSHQQLYNYFNGYAEHFELHKYIQFNTAIEKAELNAEGNWEIRLSDGSVEQFDNLLVCNGHHSVPRMPQYPGEFSGEYIHSHDYKNNRKFIGKKVLVIGGGNSACDIAVETCRVSDITYISMRRGYYFVPKFLLGKPVDQMNDGVGFVPKPIRNLIFKLLLKISVGDYSNYGLQKPDHDLLNSHPVVNSELLYFINHGKIKAKVEIDKFSGDTVHFKDGSAVDVDVIIAATGYKITFPFFDTSFIDFADGYVPLYKKVFHSKIKNLFFIGLVQPTGCIWPLSDAHAQLAANHIIGNYQLPSDIDSRIEKEIEVIKNNYMDTPRHSVEVDFHDHLAELKKEIPMNAPKWETVTA